MIHRRMRGRVAFSLAATVLAASAGVSAAEPMEIHRAQAGDFSKSSWALAESTHGRYSVRMPVAFNDISGAPDSGAVKHVYAINGLKDGIKFSVVRLDYGDDKTAAQKYFEGACASGQYGADLKECRRFEFAGHASVDLSIEGTTSWARIREVKLDDDLILMTVESSTAPQQPALPMIRRFLDSLKIQAP